MDKINTFKSENTQSQKSLWSVASGFYAEEKKNPSTTVTVFSTTICTEKEEIDSSFFNNLLGRAQTKHRSYKKLELPLAYSILHSRRWL